MQAAQNAKRRLTDALSKVFGEACETDALVAAQGVLALSLALPVLALVKVCTQIFMDHDTHFSHCTFI